MNHIPLFDEFHPVSAKQWKQKIHYDLKGADYNETLVWESPEGIKVKPFYHADDAVEVFANLKTNEGWRIGQSIYAGNAVKANEKALKALSRGAESVQFVIPSKEIKIQILFQHINLNETPVYLEFEFIDEGYVQSIIDYVGSALGNIYFNIDIIGHLARTGNWYSSLKNDFSLLDSIVGKQIHALCVDLSLYQNAGADIVQQLGYAIAHAHEYLHTFASGEIGMAPMCFKVSVGTNYFFEVAKIRALRLLWHTLATEYEQSPNCHIVAIPTKRNKVLYDYNTNMLRTTTECMAAVLGGADTVINMPYDAIYHKNNEFGERIALNQLLVLKNESYFDKVENPAEGAYYIESITQQLAEKALQLFKSIESGGGFLKQLKAHIIQKKIQESAKKEQLRFLAGDEVLVGTNRYQNPNDKMKDTIELYPFLKINARKTLIQPILEKRLAEEVEQKRLGDE